MLILHKQPPPNKLWEEIKLGSAAKTKSFNNLV